MKRAAKATPQRNLVNIGVLLRRYTCVDTHPPYNALLAIDLIADRKAYASAKHRQVNAQFIADPAHCFIWASTLPC